MELDKLKDQLDNITEAALSNIYAQIPDAEIGDLVKVVTLTSKLSKEIDEREANTIEVTASPKISPAAQRLLNGITFTEET